MRGANREEIHSRVTGGGSPAGTIAQGSDRGFLTAPSELSYIGDMDSAMRDLERIREQDDDAPSRKLAMLVMAALSTVGLVFAMGVLLRDSGAAGQNDDDPLARLDALDLEGGTEAMEERAAEDEPAPELTFHAALTQRTDPELAAAIAAADAELAVLDARERTPARSVALALSGSPGPAAAPKKATEPTALVASEPRGAGVSGDEASAEERKGYALQVASYKNPGEAETFAKELERRGYPVFVERAVIDGRGEFHRVRIGPIESRGAALRQRARFEQDERIHTLLVKL